MFGHRRGAFTGAVEDHIGLFERADGGTVFLDEIGEVSPAFQAKLLRVLQEGEIRPVGGRQMRKIDVRVIAATNRDLEAEVHAGRFREDLYYRLATVSIHVPPLRDRPMDIPVIAKMLLEKGAETVRQGRAGPFARGHRVPEDPIGGPATCASCKTRSSIFSSWGRRAGSAAEHLSRRILQASPKTEAAANPISTIAGLEGTLRERIETLEACILRESLIRHRWNKSRAAKELGLSRVGLRAKLERYGLEKIEGIPAAPKKKVASGQ